MANKGALKFGLFHYSLKKQVLARVSQDGKAKKTITRGYGDLKTIESAYEEIVGLGKQLAKEFKIAYVHKTLAELKKNGPTSKRNTLNGPNKTLEENLLVAKFGNELLFKAMIKHAVKLHGVDKTMEVLNSGLSIVKKLKNEKEREKTLISSANIEIARIIVQTRNQGIDMPSPSKEIDAAIQFVMDEANKPKPSKKVNSGVRYRLGEEEWNGCGHAPASFSAYLNANEERSLDDLIVR